MMAKTKAVPVADWEWFGEAGHFICGRWCRFHLTTKVGEYLVSTLGAYVPPSAIGGSEQTERAWLQDNWPGEDIGCDRKFETMVFKAGRPCAADRCGKCGMPEIEGSDLDSGSYNDAGSATRGHMAMCQRWAKPNPVSSWEEDDD